MDVGFREATFSENQNFDPRCENRKTHKISLHSGRNGPRMISGPHPPASAPPTQFACGSLSLSLLLALGLVSVGVLADRYSD